MTESRPAPDPLEEIAARLEQIAGELESEQAGERISTLAAEAADLASRAGSELDRARRAAASGEDALF